MSIFEIIIVSLGLSLDTFAISLSQGLNNKNLTHKSVFLYGFILSSFQAIMLSFGLFLAKSMSSLIESFDHWIAFILLVGFGLHTIIETLTRPQEIQNKSTSKNIIFFAFSTSIDAFIVGISLSMYYRSAILTIIFTTIISFILTYIGIFIGKKLVKKNTRFSSLLGGLILIFIGIKILIEHLFY